MYLPIFPCGILLGRQRLDVDARKGPAQSFVLHLAFAIDLFRV